MSEPIDTLYDELGEIAYKAYCQQQGWQTANGDDLPKWEHNFEHVREGWRRAAKAVEDYLT